MAFNNECVLITGTGSGISNSPARLSSTTIFFDDIFAFRALGHSRVAKF